MSSHLETSVLHTVLDVILLMSTHAGRTTILSQCPFEYRVMDSIWVGIFSFFCIHIIHIIHDLGTSRPVFRYVSLFERRVIISIEMQQLNPKFSFNTAEIHQDRANELFGQDKDHTVNMKVITRQNGFNY